MSRIQDTTVIGETAFNVAVFGPYPSDIKFAAAVMVKVSLRPERDYTPLLEALGIIPALPVTA